MKIVGTLKGIPIKLMEGNEGLTPEDIEMDRLANKAVKEAIEYVIKNGLPVARYDNETKQAYLEYPDGRKEYFG